MDELAPILVIGLVIFLFLLLSSIVKIVPEYERLVVLALGKYAGTRGPGITFIIPLLEEYMAIKMR